MLGTVGGVSAVVGFARYSRPHDLARARWLARPHRAFRQLTFRHGAIGGGPARAPTAQTVVYRAAWAGARPELVIVRPEKSAVGLAGTRRTPGSTRCRLGTKLAVALGCRLNWGQMPRDARSQVPMAGGSPRGDGQGRARSPTGVATVCAWRSCSFAGDSYASRLPDRQGPLPRHRDG